MNDSIFTSCALVLLAKADELVGDYAFCEADYYANNPALLTVSRTVDGYWAGIVDHDQQDPAHEDWLVRTGRHANEQAALIRLGILLQDQLDERAAAKAA